MLAQRIRISGNLMLALAAATIAQAGTEADEIRELRAQIRALERKLEAIEQRQLAQPAATPAAPAPAQVPAPAAAKVTANDPGFSIASADGANSIRLRGLIQLDARQYLDETEAATDTFVLRRARLISEGVLARDFAFQLVSEFGGNSASILDANLSLSLTPDLQLKFGKFKSPLGLEQLQSDSWTFFNERSIVSNLAPNRDLGIQASGNAWGGRLNYALGVFNGVPDAGSAGNTDGDNDKDIVGRVLVTPFRDRDGSPLQGLALGLGGSVGRSKGTAGRTSGYRTDGQQSFFAFQSATIADGATWRLAPQFDFRRGPFGLLGEYTVSTVAVRAGAAGPRTDLQNTAWQVAAGWVLTGEASSANGVAPRASFSFADGTWGAFEIAGRWAQVRLDDAAFPVYASAAANAAGADALGLGLNWYLSKAVVFKFDAYRTEFVSPAGAPAVSANPVLRADEEVFISRFQIGF